MIDAQGRQRDVPCLFLGSVYGNLLAMRSHKLSYPAACFLHANEVRGAGVC
jgi:hypothetical protein